MKTIQLLSAVGVSEKGFFTPYNYLRSVDWDAPDYPSVRPFFAAAAEGRFRDYLAQIDANEPRFEAMRADDTVAPSWTSGYLPPLDAAAIYTFLTAFRPPRVVEIGCGNSTLFMARAVIDHGLPTKITCIDPSPRVPIDGLPVQFQRRLLTHADVDALAATEPGDLLFVDSSHILQQGFDVDIILNRVLPVLRPGVFVHFHDIFLPYPYPRHWEERHFNEQCALLPWILCGALRIEFASHYVLRDMPDDLRKTCAGFPPLRKPAGGSLFLRRI